MTRSGGDSGRKVGSPHTCPRHRALFGTGDCFATWRAVALSGSARKSFDPGGRQVSGGAKRHLDFFLAFFRVFLLVFFGAALFFAFGPAGAFFFSSSFFFGAAAPSLLPFIRSQPLPPP